MDSWQISNMNRCEQDHNGDFERERQKSILQRLLEIGQFDAPFLQEIVTLVSPLNQTQAMDLERQKSMDRLLDQLLRIDTFYREIGGIAGYQKKIVELLESGQKEVKKDLAFHTPSFIDISQETDETWKYLLHGIETLGQMAEMIPLGGAADRLHLVDEQTNEELPAARLSFGGRSLLAMLIRDLQAREYLHYKLYGKQITTPLALMTSEEKDNHRHVAALLAENRWFGRPPSSFRLFTQPLVPVVSENGEWRWVAPFRLLMKPGGHGVIWKLARDEGIFDWFQKLGRTKTLIRQINNPIAGLDYGFLVFCGVGVMQNKAFGFASCPRLIGSAEGMNVLLENRETAEVSLTNVEYCDFAKFGIEDAPLKLGEPYSRFTSNTNILFADLQKLSSAVERCPYPGLLVNLKKIAYVTEAGEKREEKMARLEATMQNIADAFAEKRGETLKTEQTFVTYNHRHKTISTAKRAYVPGGLSQETPERCFYDLVSASRELLEKRCGWKWPGPRTLEEHLLFGPEALCLYHPALGPLYHIIAQKLRSGRMGPGAEMQLEIADLDCEALDLEGSFLIVAKQVMGHGEEILRYSEKTGRVCCKNVVIRNRGVNWAKSAPFWKNRFERHEALEVILEGHSEWIAEDVVLMGSHRFVVEDGVRMRLVSQGGKVIVMREKMDAAPLWHYEKSDKITLTRSGK
jgi:hypothetical protein